MLSDDMTLVREFAARQSEPAFAALVKRHIGLVHLAALRQTGDAHLAEEITQAVFIILARKAAALGPNTILAAWLYRTTRYAAADALKTRRRREAREQEACMQSTLNQPDNDAGDAWAQLAPLLDDALNELGETDRTALVLRFFENKTAREIAAALQLEENAAQKRVARALEKLRARFVKRGVTLTAAVIAGAVAANSAPAAPAALVKSVTAVAMAKGSMAAASTQTLVKGTIKIMTWMKFKLAVGIGAAVLLAGGAMTVAVSQISSHDRSTPQATAKESQAAAPVLDIATVVSQKGADGRFHVLFRPSFRVESGKSASMISQQNAPGDPDKIELALTPTLLDETNVLVKFVLTGHTGGIKTDYDSQFMAVLGKQVKIRGETFQLTVTPSLALAH
jgi:RNA polymerase sigma factor (sigma-70 family)